MPTSWFACSEAEKIQNTTVQIMDRKEFMTIERPQELNRRLTALLDDPQPGLATRCMFLGKVMQELTEEWNQSE